VSLDAGVQQALEKFADIGINCQQVILVSDGFGYLRWGLLCNVHGDSPGLGLGLSLDWVFGYLPRIGFVPAAGTALLHTHNSRGSALHTLDLTTIIWKIASPWCGGGAQRKLLLATVTCYSALPAWGSGECEIKWCL
jgi:hypothetical protein